MLATFNLRDLGLPGRTRAQIRLNTGRTVADGVFRPVLRSLEMQAEFRNAVGGAPEDFSISTRIYEFPLQSKDDVVLEAAGAALPLIIRRQGEVIASFDIAATQHFQFSDSKRPLYTHVPGFNIQRIPEGLRRSVSNLIQQLRSPANGNVVQEYRKLPLTGFEAILLFLNMASEETSIGRKRVFEWPEGKRAAFLSLHDVDSGGFLQRKERDPLFRVEQKHGIRATWFVPTAIGKNRESVRFLIDTGQDVGWHGHSHDHRLPFAPYADDRVRILRGSYLAEPDRFPVGMRTPKLLKSHHLFELLDESCPPLCYDTSFLHGILPYYLWLKGARSRLLEIPTTVPADIRVHNQLRGVSGRRKFETILEAQITRTKRLMDVGGIVSIVTHPEKHLTERPELLDVYDRYLSFVRSQSDLWFVTAGELYKYWTGRDQPELVENRSPSAANCDLDNA